MEIRYDFRPLASKAASLVVTYGAWLISALLALCVCYVWRSALLKLYVARVAYPPAFALFNLVVTTLLGLGWLGFVSATEGWYRSLAERSLLGARFKEVAAIAFAWTMIGLALYLTASP